MAGGGEEEGEGVEGGGGEIGAGLDVEAVEEGAGEEEDAGAQGGSGAVGLVIAGVVEPFAPEDIGDEPEDAVEGPGKAEEVWMEGREEGPAEDDAGEFEAGEILKAFFAGEEGPGVGGGEEGEGGCREPRVGGNPRERKQESEESEENDGGLEGAVAGEPGAAVGGVAAVFGGEAAGAVEAVNGEGGAEDEELKGGGGFDPAPTGGAEEKAPGNQRHMDVEVQEGLNRGT